LPTVNITHGFLLKAKPAKKGYNAFKDIANDVISKHTHSTDRISDLVLIRQLSATYGNGRKQENRLSAHPLNLLE